jgi:hypothetical protein
MPATPSVTASISASDATSAPAIKRERTDDGEGSKPRKKKKLYKETTFIDMTEDWENGFVVD